MIRHLFKLVWNRKRSSFLLLIQLFVSFLVLFAISSILFYNFNSYLQPLGFSYENVWVLRLTPPPGDAKGKGETVYQLKQKISSYQQVESVAGMEYYAIPYTGGFAGGQATYNKKDVQIRKFAISDDFINVFKLTLVEGRWFSSLDNASRLTPVVISQGLKEELFGNASPIGKIISFEGEKLVVGVVQNLKAAGEFGQTNPEVFVRQTFTHPDDILFNTLVMKVKPGNGVAFEGKLMKELINMAKDWSLEMEQLEDMRKTNFKITFIPLLILTIIGGFLLFNVALGLFGVLWYNIHQRRSEIGLRRTFGALSNRIFQQFLGEVWVLATLGMLIGILLAAQFPILNVFGVAPKIYILAILFSVAFIYLLVTVCAIYPSRLATRIQPAEALHED